MHNKYFVCSLLVLVLIGVFVGSVKAQSPPTKYSSFDNKYQGIKFQYPSYWQIDRKYLNESLCVDDNYCTVYFELPVQPNQILVKIDSKPEHPKSCFLVFCSTIKDYAKERLEENMWLKGQFNKDSSGVPQLTAISDNETKINGIPSWQMEYSTVDAIGQYGNNRGYVLWTRFNNTGYEIFFFQDIQTYQKHLPELIHLIKTIQFTPLYKNPPPPPPVASKQPSFMN